MKMIRYSGLVVFFSSFVCYGSERSWIDEGSSITSDSLKETLKKITNPPTDSSLEEEIFNDENEEDQGSWVKGAGLGLGKLGLGSLCAYLAVTTLLKSNVESFNPKRANENFIYSNFNEWCENFAKRSIVNSLFGNNPNIINTRLCHLLSSFCLVGVSTYGGYKCMASAYDSFKKTYKKIPNRSALDGMGKLGLGVISGCIAAATLLQTYKDKRIKEENEIMVSLKECSSHVKDDGILQTIFAKSDNFYVMDSWLNNLFSKFSLLGVSTYAACHYTAAAWSSFKEAYENITTSATDSSVEEVDEKKDLDLEKRN